MTQRKESTRLLRTAMAAAALLLPALSLIPLGSVWLWQNGYLLYWVGAALVLSSASYAVQWWLISPTTTRSFSERDGTSVPPEGASWTPRETAAWRAVELLADKAGQTDLTSQDAVVALGLRTIETVARNIHPDDKDPLWKFTVPEALALFERVSADLRPFVIDNVPLGDQLTVSQALKIYQWRSAIDVAEKAYDLWRIVRLVNPIAAVTNEARERLTKTLYTGVRDELAAKLSRGFVKAVGRAAIDLYGGRLRVLPKDLESPLSNAAGRARKSAESSEPLRLLVAGQKRAGKSTLINALLGVSPTMADPSPATSSYTALTMIHDRFPSSVLIDSPGVQPHSWSMKRLASEAGKCDLLIWVVAADHADRGLDSKALNAVRAHFNGMTDRRAPPTIVVVTSSDPLPLGNGRPPRPDSASSIPESLGATRTAMVKISKELGVGMENIIPVSFAGDKRDDVELVWAKLVEVLPEIRHAHLVRRLRGASGWRWGQLWSQTVNAGKSATRIWSKPPAE